ncbi:MAG: phosphatidate cytidylyltransferase [Alphaproteobacteria bacterium]|nr:phosphatidate cytidylyltransferase [Alphaproteobacteria bacterium]
MTGGSAASGVTSSDGAPHEAAPASKLDDLGPRVASALVLAVFGLTVTIIGGPWIAGATGAAVVIMSYEWTRMSEPHSLSAAFAFCVIGALGAVMAASWGQYPLAFAIMAACGIASALRRRSISQALETAGGVVYIAAPCVLFLALRGHEPEGAKIILGLFAIIWSADAAAYFGGKLIGGPKLVPNLSPAKTWSGFASGTLAGMTAAGVFAAVIGGPAPLWAFVGAALALIGLFGDLFESLLKRRFGVKDASRVIPGHGGVLDRIDGLMAATVATSIALALSPGFWLALLGRAA